MSKVQIEKDLKELYGEANLNLQLEEYYKKKRKDMLLLLLVIIGILIISFVTDEQQRKIENNNLTRNIKGQGKKEYQLEIKVSEEEWQPFSVILEEKEYTLEEIEVLAEGAMEKLCQAILNENESLSAVENNLNLIVQFDEYPFVIQWESTKPEFIDNDGVLNFENIRKPEIVDLKVELQYGLWKKEEKISITVLPKSKEDTLYYLKHKIQKSQSEDKETSNFHLPEIYDSKNLQWRYPSNNSTKVILVLCLLLVPFISYQKDMEIHRITKIRKEELLYSFPDFISRLILYLEAGMSVQGSLFRMEQEYKKKKRKEKNYLFEELSYVCRQMKNGLPQKEGYELLAKRCNLPCYRKLSGLIIQHVEKGSITILETLKKEGKKAQEEQKGRIQKKGEEIETKLLFPMIIMLGIVMVFIMVPALFSFQM